MARPTCPRHPKSRIWRYGNNGQFQRGRCVPRNGDVSHGSTPPLSLRGGPNGACLECGRPWMPWEGMPTGIDDRFSLHKKALALVEIAHGASCRQAGRNIRDRAGLYKTRPDGTLEVSPDERISMDCVPH